MKKSSFPKGSVCKPCWELKYCPYGVLVEFFPAAHPVVKFDLSISKTRYQEVLEEIKQLKNITPEDIFEYFRLLSYLEPDNQEFVEKYFSEIGCRMFGHACPVFFVQSRGTETKDERSKSRNISRQVMLQVVRRDNHVCQVCHKYVADDEIEFDHIIPYSKGGPTTVANLRLLCRKCNRKKSNFLDEILYK